MDWKNRSGRSSRTHIGRTLSPASRRLKERLGQLQVVRGDRVSSPLRRSDCRGEPRSTCGAGTTSSAAVAPPTASATSACGSSGAAGTLNTRLAPRLARRHSRRRPGRWLRPRCRGASRFRTKDGHERLLRPARPRRRRTCHRHRRRGNSVGFRERRGNAETIPRLCHLYLIPAEEDENPEGT